MKPGPTQDGFVNAPFIGASSDGRNWTAYQQLCWWWRGRLYRCVIGATTDGASTPQITWNVLPPFGWYWLAALAHDFAYRGQTEVQNPDGTWTRIQMTFADCNAMILDLMTTLQVDRMFSPILWCEQEAEKQTIYQAVSQAGQAAFSGDLALPIPKPVKTDSTPHPGPLPDRGGEGGGKDS